MELLLILFLILLNGVFAMSEIAVVTAKKARLQMRADQGHRSAMLVLKLQDAPSSFLSTIQVGITSIAILSGAVGENALAGPLEEWLLGFAPLAPYSEGLSLALVVISITYLSVVVGELVPKRLALVAPEALASLVARPMNGLAAAARPVVWLLSVSSDLLLRLWPGAREKAEPVSNEEIRALMGQGAEAGVFHESEQALVANVLRLDDQHVNEVMTQRKDVVYVDLADPQDVIRQRIIDASHSRLLVCEGGVEQVVGVLRVTDLVKAAMAGEPLDIRRVMREPVFIPESISLTRLFEQFRSMRTQLACIVDEYGALQGVVTVTDVMEAIVGEVPEDDHRQAPELVRREDGSWLVDGGMAIQRFKDALGLQRLDPDAEHAYYTMGGFAMFELGRVPATADSFICAGHRFEVVDMDGSRVDKLLVHALPPEEPEVPHVDT